MWSEHGTRNVDTRSFRENDEEKTRMKAKSTTSKQQQLSRGQRRHVRKLKQEAHRAGTVYRSPFGANRPQGTLKKETQPQKIL